MFSGWPGLFNGNDGEGALNEGTCHRLRRRDARSGERRTAQRPGIDLPVSGEHGAFVIFGAGTGAIAFSDAAAPGRIGGKRGERLSQRRIGPRRHDERRVFRRNHGRDIAHGRGDDRQPGRHRFYHGNGELFAIGRKGEQIEQADHARGEEEAAYTIFAVEEDEEEEVVADAPLVIAETRVDIPTASVADAVMMMDLRNTTALFFKNAGTGRHNMVYRRADGSIGWVEPR